MSPTIAILDYGGGNLTSVACAVRHLGHEPVVTSDPDLVRKADRVIFPGVGAARASMENLTSRGLGAAFLDVQRSGRPVLGICIGCQVILTSSEEDGGTPCLGIIPGLVRRFSFAPGVQRKIPHMGWNEVTFTGRHPVFQGIPPGSQFYFVHSYYPDPEDRTVVQGTACYGGLRFAAAFARDNLAAVQFHTEKSGAPGLKILQSFLEWKPA